MNTRRKSEREFSHYKVDDLCAHPLNEQVYGPAKLDEKFLKSIRDFGILEPLLVARLSFDGANYLNYILSGHRRFAAAQKIGLKKVPIRWWSLDEGVST